MGSAGAATEKAKGGGLDALSASSTSGSSPAGGRARGVSAPREADLWP
jgi:hypothetical protein